MPFIREYTWPMAGGGLREQRKRPCAEGTQGAGLSLYHGTCPHVTSRDTSVAGCLSEAGVPPSRVKKGDHGMVIRTYPIRVESPNEATSGPMDLEDWIGKRYHVVREFRSDQLQKTEKTSTTDQKEAGWGV